MRYRLEFVSEYRSDESPNGSWCVYDTQDSDFGLESFNSQDEARQYRDRLNHIEEWGDETSGDWGVQVAYYSQDGTQRIYR